MSVPPPAAIRRLILGDPAHLDAEGKPDPRPGVAEMLELHERWVTAKVADWSTTLVRPGDQAQADRIVTVTVDDDAGSALTHSDPTGASATGYDELREIDRQWERALIIATSTANRITGNRASSPAHALRDAVGTIGSQTRPKDLRRLHWACTELHRIIGMCRPDLTPPEAVKVERVCPACVSPHEDRRPQCPACRKLHQRNAQMDDNEFNQWVRDRIRQGTLSRPRSKWHQRKEAFAELVALSEEFGLYNDPKDVA